MTTKLPQRTTTATAAAIKLPVMAPYHSEWNCSSIHRRDRPTDRPPYRLYGVISLIKMSSARYILATNFPLEPEKGEAGWRARVELAGIIVVMGRPRESFQFCPN